MPETASPRVIVALPGPNGRPSVFAHGLTRRLRVGGWDARVLVDVASLSPAEAVNGAGPVDDLPCDRLPVSGQDGRCQRWEAIERYLEERAPCIFLVSPEWREAAVARRLSHRVILLVLVSTDDEATFARVERLGPSLNALVADREQIHFSMACRLPHLAHRMVTIPHAAFVSTAGMPSGSDPAERGFDDSVTSFVALFGRLEAQVERHGFMRPRQRVVTLPEPAGQPPRLIASHYADIESISRVTPWPNRPASPLKLRAFRQSSQRLEDHRVIVSYSPGSISGVDTFAAHLVRELRSRGIDGRLHGRRRPDDDAALAVPADLPFDELPPHLIADYISWHERWRGMAEHLERLAPCIYIPNYDDDYSCVSPLVSDGVKVVGVAHSDDPWHYEHLSRIGNACDAVVGVSSAINRHLELLTPALAPRLHMIPYGIPLPGRSIVEKDRESSTDRVFRVIYAGRLLQHQKRAADLVAIAAALARRGLSFELIVVGEGSLRGEMEREGRELVLRRQLWFVGHQSNDDVLRLFEQCDAFLLPSAFEGCSIAMLEAMARGLVPVVSDIRSGVPDVVTNGVNGFTAAVGDVEGFVEKLAALADDRGLRRRLGAAAAQTVRVGYSLDAMVDRYIELFHQICARPLARPVGPVVPPAHLSREGTWSLWATRVAKDPLASVGRVVKRFVPHRR